MKSLTPILCSLLLGLAGCAGAHATEAPAQTAIASPEANYVAALDEAFSTYEAEIQNALRLEYNSEAEAEAVSLSLSPRRFDYLLEKALQSRGTSTDQLAAYADQNPDFFHTQQQRYWGHLHMLHRAAESVASMGPAPAEQVASRN